ncbi:hypothetical protein BJY01DRAFT_32935 [Aspergillus pseudoustus]|uniref:Uncharacterized protein n=1 Tax=Aspergillus pseudoustus TaxID=1810923 RepID=A0ABR4JFL9_9EURO
MELLPGVVWGSSWRSSIGAKFGSRGRESTSRLWRNLTGGAGAGALNLDERQLIERSGTGGKIAGEFFRRSEYFRLSFHPGFPQKGTNRKGTFPLFEKETVKRRSQNRQLSEKVYYPPHTTPEHPLFDFHLGNENPRVSAEFQSLSRSLQTANDVGPLERRCSILDLPVESHRASSAVFSPLSAKSTSSSRLQGPIIPIIIIFFFQATKERRVAFSSNNNRHRLYR